MSSSRALFVRLLVALAVGLLGVVGLALAVEALESEPKRTMRARPARQVGGAVETAQSFEMPTPEHAVAVGFELRPLVGALAVGARLSAIPRDVAPVIEVFGDGSLALRRPNGLGAGVVLPGRSLDELTPQARGALGGLLVRWFPGRPVPSSRIRPVGFEAAEQDLARLLAWLP